MKARKRAGGRRPPLGQHFLQEASWRRRILAQLDPQPEDCWLEVGAGHGEFSVPLARASRAVAAVERDAKLAALLREQLGAFPAARVIEADILDLDIKALARESGPTKLRVYGSLPYYITSPILRRLFDSLAVIADIHVVVQREVAERLVAGPGGRGYGYLSVLAQFHARPELVLAVPRGAFRPAPKVDSALVRLVTPGQQESLQVGSSAKFLEFLSACFRQKRKTLRNNLRAALPGSRLEGALAEAGLAPRARAEELSLESLARLFAAVERAGGSFAGQRTTVIASALRRS